MKIYTKKGDAGTTSLIGGERVMKDDVRVEAYGNVDELSAFTALLKDKMKDIWGLEEFRNDLCNVLNTLMSVEALLAQGGNGNTKVKDISEDSILFLEGRIDIISLSLKPIERFTIPGGHVLVSLSHVCRTVCRRAERSAVKAAREFEISANAVVYLNRLSDYFYQMGRKLCELLDTDEVCWEPPH